MYLSYFTYPFELMTHYTPNKSFSSPISIINRIAYQLGNKTFEPIEEVSLGKSIDNLKREDTQKEILEKILKSKKEEEEALKTHLISLCNAANNQN